METSSASVGMSSAAFAVSAMAASNAARANERAEQALLLQCKKTYDSEICSDVCTQTTSFKQSNVSLWKGVYQKTTINECKNSIHDYKEILPRGDTVSGLIIGFILLVVLAIFIKKQTEDFYY